MGTLECIDAFKTAMNSDTGGGVDVAIDFHGASATTNPVYAVVESSAGMYDYFHTEFDALDTAFFLNTQTINESLYHWWVATLGADLSVTIEIGGSKSRSVSQIKGSGENAMKSLYEMLVDGRFPYGP